MPDYIRFCLTGEYARGIGCQRHAALGCAQPKWAMRFSRSCKVTRTCLERCMSPRRLPEQSAKGQRSLQGWLRAPFCIACGGDQAAGAVGNGIVKPGIISSTIGTSGGICLYRQGEHRSQRPCPYLLPCCTQHLAHHGCYQGAGLSLQWFRNNFCHERFLPLVFWELTHTT